MRTATKPLHVSGLACPWNVYNDYNELMKPGAFKAFLAELDGKPLPMGFMHRAPAGEWTELRETEEGLWVRGVVTDPSAQEYVREGVTLQLSITYLNGKFEESYERFNTRPAWARNSRLAKQYKLLDKVDVSTVSDLAEISLVDGGSFPGTYLLIDEP